VDVALAAGLAAVVVSTGVLIKGGRSTNAPIIDIPEMKIPSPDSNNNPDPILKNCDGPAVYNCYLAPVVIASLFLKSLLTGGCGEDESLCTNSASTPVPNQNASQVSTNEVFLPTHPVAPHPVHIIIGIYSKPGMVNTTLSDRHPNLDFEHQRYGEQP